MSNSMNTNSDLMVYQTDSGALEVRFDGKHDTVWCLRRADGGFV